MFTVCCGFPLNLAVRADVMLFHQPVNGSPATGNGFSDFRPNGVQTISRMLLMHLPDPAKTPGVSISSS